MNINMIILVIVVTILLTMTITIMVVAGRLPAAATINPPRPGADELPSEAYGIENKTRMTITIMILLAAWQLSIPTKANLVL